MTTHEKITALRVHLEKPFSDFYVLILPMNNPPDTEKDYRDFYLICDGYSTIIDMFGCAVENEENAVEMALSNACDYISIWLEKTNL